MDVGDWNISQKQTEAVLVAVWKLNIKPTVLKSLLLDEYSASPSPTPRGPTLPTNLVPDVWSPGHTYLCPHFSGQNL